MKHTRIATAAALVAVGCAAHPLRAQRDLYGLGGATTNDTRRQFTAEAREKVGALMAEYESAWGSRDLRALMRLYGDAATLYPPEGGVVMGREAVQGYFARLLPAVEPLRTRIVEFKAAGDLAFATVQVSYAVKDGAAQRAYTGIDVVVLRKDWAGDWAIVTHFFRSDGPAMAATRPAGTAPDSAGSQ